MLAIRWCARFTENRYCWGNASTAWGKLRHDDGHPAPYRLKFIELGNEQFNTFYVEQVAAMERKAEAVGVGGQLYYISPQVSQRRSSISAQTCHYSVAV